jgi:hypothetical protein
MDRRHPPEPENFYSVRHEPLLPVRPQPIATIIVFCGGGGDRLAAQVALSFVVCGSA